MDLTYEQSLNYGLVVSQEQVDQINALLGPGTRVEAHPMTSGGSAIRASVLTDCGERGIYAPARAILLGLQVVPWDIAEEDEPEEDDV